MLLVGGGNQPPPCARSNGARAERARGAWVTPPSAGSIVVGYQCRGDARTAFRRPPPDLPLQDPVLGGGGAVLGHTARYAGS